MIRLLPLLALLLTGCASSDSAPGETVPGPPRELVEKGSKPPIGGVPPQATSGATGP